MFELQLGRSGAASAKARGPAPFDGLRKWRNKASIEALSGRVVVDDATGALVRCDIYGEVRHQGRAPSAVQGTVEVHTVLTEVASTPAIEKPAAEDLAMRQRTLPEQRELLRGLGQARAAAEPPRAGARRRRRARAVKPGRPRPARRQARPRRHEGRAMSDREPERPELVAPARVAAEDARRASGTWPTTAG